MKNEAKIYKEVGKTRTDFDPVKFNGKIQEKGLRISWEKMIVCPCRKSISDQAVVECVNCKGTGYHFFGKTEMRALISGAQMSRNLQSWTEELQGSIYVSVDPIYNVGYFDKITVLDATSIFSEVCQVKVVEEENIIVEKYINAKYNIDSILKIYKYIGENVGLYEITEDKITISGNKITIEDNNISEGDNISICYRYNPVYLVIDNLNEYRNTYVKQGYSTEQLQKMPIRILAKKMHLVLV